MTRCEHPAGWLNMITIIVHELPAGTASL